MQKWTDVGLEFRSRGSVCAVENGRLWLVAPAGSAVSQARTPARVIRGSEASVHNQPNEPNKGG